MIKYSDEAKRAIENENLKVPLKDVLRVSSEELDIEEIIADQFTFQNLGQVNKAYQKYLGLDIVKVFSQKKKVDKKIFRLYQKIEEIIEIRHSIVHHFGYYLNLDRSKFLEYLRIIEVALEVFIQYLDTKHNWDISENSL
jgi:hypothetical protein